MQKVCQILIFIIPDSPLFFRIVLKIPLISNLILFSYNVCYVAHALVFFHPVMKMRQFKSSEERECFLYISFIHQRTNNAMEWYNREFNTLFDSPRTGLFVFCERVQEEASRWERLHEDALKGKFKHWQKKEWSSLARDSRGFWWVDAAKKE